MPEFFVNFNDIDGNTALQEINWAQYPQSYTTDNPTTLSFNDEGGWLIATAGTVNFPGSCQVVLIGAGDDSALQGTFR